MKNNNVQTAWRISLAYVLLVSCWIFISDYLLGIFLPDPQHITRLATYSRMSW